MSAKRDLLAASQLQREELTNLLELAERLTQSRTGRVLTGRSIALLWFDRSLRTRVSFELAIVQLGGHCINLVAPNEIYGLESEEHAVMDGVAEEHVVDSAKTLSRYVDLIGIRRIDTGGTWEEDRQQRLLRAYAEAATVPVVNLESVLEHPCQALADVLTMRRKLLDLRGRKLTIAWANHPKRKSLGPVHSLLTMAGTLGLDITLAHPLGFEPEQGVVQEAHRRAEEAGGRVRTVHDLRVGVQDADIVYSRAWSSPKYWTDPDREAMVKRSLEDWRIDRTVLSRAQPNALFMHPLPVRRNVVATDDVLDGPNSLIYDQAENRVPAQKALLTHLLG